MKKQILIAIAFAVVAAVALVPGVSLASAKFSDVPNSHQFSGDITWLSNSGVTNGCGTGVFCPEENVTRGQMAAFIHRLSAGRVVDAATLQGMGPADLQGAAGPAGPAGAQGPAGPQGAQGDPGVAGVNVVTAGVGSVAAGTGGSISATCGSGETVLSGGFSGGSEELTVFESRPNGSSWTVSHYNNGPGTPGITVYAICATVGS